MSTDFLTIDESAIPEGGNNFGPLDEGSYNATCVAMLSGTGTKYKSDEPEKKIRFVFAIEEEDEQGAIQTHFVRSNWMRISLWDGEPNPSALWNLLRAWTKQKSADELIQKMGKFDIKFFIGKPINLVLKHNKDGKHNVISDYITPKKGQVVIGSCEIPEFHVSADKQVQSDIKFIMMDGCTIKPSKKKTTKQTSVKDDDVTAVPDEGTDGSNGLPF